MSAITQPFSTLATNASNERINMNQIMMAEDQFDRNMEFQREQYEYGKELQQKEWEREDTAVQRQVADSRAAGISPLANLSGSSSSVSSPAVGGVAGQVPASIPMQPVNIGDVLGTIIQGVSAVQDVKSKSLQNKLDAQTLDYNSSANTYKLMEQSFHALSQSEAFENLMRDSNFKKYYGITDSMTREQQIMQVIKRDVLHMPAAGKSSNYYYPGVGSGVNQMGSFRDIDWSQDNISLDKLMKSVQDIYTAFKSYNKQNGGSRKEYTNKDIDDAYNNLMHLAK